MVVFGHCFDSPSYRFVLTSGKMTGTDRKLQVALEQSLQDQLGSPNSERLSVSPFGPLTDRLSRQTLIYLITTLNCAFPYYDFRYAAQGGSILALSASQRKKRILAPKAAEREERYGPPTDDSRRPSWL